MASRHRVFLIVFAAAIVACGPAERPTPTPPRPTQIIAIPLATATQLVTATPTRTNTPVVIRATPTLARPTTRATPTRTLTLRPTASRTATAASPQPTAATSTPTTTATATATNTSLRYKSANKGCEHSGQTFIQGTIYRGSDRVNGVTVVMSGFPEGAIVAQRVSGTDGDGFYSIIVNASGSANGQKRWVWVIENSLRASDVVQFDFNNLKASDPAAACWRGFVDFVQQY